MQAVSTDVSDQSVANGSMFDSAGASDSVPEEPPSNFPMSHNRRTPAQPVAPRPQAPTLQDPHQVINHFPAKITRGRGVPMELDSGDEDTFECAALKFPPRTGNDAVAVNKVCYLTHPDTGDKVIAEGKTGGSWKAKAQKLGHLCNQGQQMVQVHRIIIQNVRLLHVEERQPFLTVDEAVVKPTGSNVFVKWDSKHIHKKTT